ncbi:restriction endonuclease subunit R [Candidatus Wirthbacteria bacterium CG2_30_54_11]|uniref:Restriction endonuclease subunit R n=1 Tax=Candidatus Wirthbacteria bacterium CG2_30_54_11 TaxID=1817892 RepID=A0A1J5J7C9_9BACT|nr:MAG: restriction endonuclease subunit R [Candidatus Wirthbacteria bacterium CG2_30_54_11]
MSKEAKARISINRLLEESGWRFDSDQNGPANIRLEPGIKYAELGDDFEHETHGFIDFLLLDRDGRALVVVEAKRESVDPLSAKEQARTYARNAGARFVILSNGNIHYFWDTKHGNPETISRFPTQESITQYETYTPDPDELALTPVDENYIIASQMPSFAADPAFREDATRSEYLKKNNLKQLRPYQVEAIRALQGSAKAGNQRFLFEMATGTGKTLISSAVIKLFLQSGNARRVLFLVDRLELEDQAQKAFKQHLGKDYRSAIYKENRESWQNASIVVSTIQTFLAGDRYRKEFSPTDFELVISDEAHRSIGGNSRVVFEYFVGYKLGLTATPKNYLHGVDTESVDSQREYERRVLLDTYKTFGCDAGTPTFSYDLLKGAKEGFLIQPTLVDARTEITNGLLSDVGYSVHTTTDEGDSIDGVFTEKHYEKKFFNEATNVAMCTALLDNGLFDPVAAEYGVKLFGKSIVFCVSQKHAARVTNILNKLAMKRWPEQYSGSDFAVQVTSLVQGAQQMTINFSNNNLNGKVSSPPAYDSSKSRIAVTVGMMTTGYDCQDILNLALMRPVFSPSEFVQIKGRGTRRYRFEYLDYETKQTLTKDKNRYKFFDFFAVCEYFEDEYPYDEKIKLPHLKSATLDDDAKDSESPAEEEARKAAQGPFDIAMQDDVVSVIETPVGLQGMRIDREGFKRALDEDVLGNAALQAMWTNGDVSDAIEYAKTNIFDKPKHFLNLDKVRQLFRVDRRIGVKEFLQFAFGQKKAFESKDELLESEWSKFLEVNPVDQEHYAPVKSYFKAYIVDHEVQDIIRTKQLAKLNFCLSFGFDEYQKLNGYKTIVPLYVKDYVPLNTFMD